MRHIILSIIVFICLAKNNATAQYWSAVGKGIGYLTTVQNSEGAVDGYDLPFMGEPVASLCEYKGELYAAGFIDHLPDLGVNVNNIVKWNGTNWSTVGTGIDYAWGEHWVNALIVYNGDLYAGGHFTYVGGQQMNNIAKWNGTEWSPVGAGLGTYGYAVSSLAIYNGELYAGGHFYNSGGTPLNNIAKWNGTEWSAVGTGIKVYTDDYFSGSVSSLAAYNGSLYAGGSFDTAGSIRANNLARWDGNNWSPVGTGVTSEANDYGARAFVSSLTVHDGGLYVGGDFDTASGIQVKNIAKWDETNWTSLASGIDGYITSLSSYDGHLIVGGFFDTVANVAANCITKWNGVDWSSFGKGMDNGVSCLATFSGVLYAGGYFKNAGNIWANQIAKWTSQCNSAPPQPEPIIEWGTACKNQYAGYYINPVTDASDFTWTLPPGWTGNSISNRITVLAGTNAGIISVTANNPCGSSIPRTIPITPLDTVPLVIDAINGNSSVCANSIQTYFVNPVQTATNYFWILPSGWSGGSTTNTLTATTGANGGIISVRARNRCSSSNAQTISVTINPTLQPGVITGSSSVYAGQTVNYSINQVTNATGYTWYLNGGGTIISGQNTNSIVISWQTPGSYMLSATASNTCGNSPNQTLRITVSIATGVSNPGNSFEIKLLPNPSSGEIYLKAKEVQNKLIRVDITNSIGQKVYQSGPMMGANSYTQLINLDKMPPGIYAVKIIIDDKVYVRRISIAR